MTLSHRCYRPPRPAMAPPARRLRRPSARRSDPTRAGSARRTVPSAETVWTTAINGNGQQHFQGDIRDDPLSLLLYFLFMLQDIITQVLPSSPSGPPGAPPPPSVRSSFGSYESCVCTANRPIRRDSVDDRHQRQRPFGSYESCVCTANRSIRRDSVDDRHQRQRPTAFFQGDTIQREGYFYGDTK